MADGKKDTVLGLGDRLRSARKARALTLDQAAIALHLDPATLRALEEEQFAALGGGVYVRGHLKAYARLLGLSEEAAMAAYRAADPAADSAPKVKRELEKPLSTAPGPAAVAAAVAFVLVAIVLLYVLSGGTDSPPPTTLPATENDVIETLPRAQVEPARDAGAATIGSAVDATATEKSDTPDLGTEPPIE